MITYFYLILLGIIPMFMYLANFMYILIKDFYIIIIFDLLIKQISKY